MSETKIEKIAVLCSGGDAPGMNAALRAIVRMGSAHGVQVVGIERGYSGLLEGSFRCLEVRSVGNIIHRGGTILCSSRCKEFVQEKAQRRAASILEANEIGALILLGGEGTFKGAHALSRFFHGSLIGIPATIDNDVYGSDYTIGFHTALDTALRAIDQIRDTADSHNRYFFIEVMGRHTGWIALYSGIAGGAEEIVLPEENENIDAAYKRLRDAKQRGKASCIMVLAEGASKENAVDLAKRFEKETQNDCRALILGHQQRGGSPTAIDRTLATELGAFATESALTGKSNVMVGKLEHKLHCVPLEETWSKSKPLDPYLMELQSALAG